MASSSERTPRSSSRATGSATGSSSRRILALVAVVRERQARDPLWSHLALNGRWICPFCVGAIARRPGRSNDESLAAHLDGCRAFAGGRGQPQTAEAIARKAAYENVSHLAGSDPAWRIYGHDGIWFCPACLGRIPSVRLNNGQLGSFVFQAMCDHLARCGPWQQGNVQTVTVVNAARDRTAQIPVLAKSVAGQLPSPVWRYVDPSGAWVCPCCLAPVSAVRLSTPADWQNAPEAMAGHLLLGCRAYRPDRLEIQPETAVQRAAQVVTSTPLPAPAARLRSPRPGLGTTSKIRGTPTVGLRTPQVTRGIRSLSSPDMQASGLDRPATAAPPVARPVSETNPILPVTVPTRERTPPTIDVATAAKEAVAASFLNDLAEDEIRTATPAPTAPPIASPPDNLGWMDMAEKRGQTNTETAPPRDDMARARELQQDLLQIAPTIPGYRFATRFEACAEISGDFYEFIPLADGRLGFAMGDVSGHGVEAGMIMSMAKKTLEIYAQSGSPPSEVLVRVNDALARDLGGKLFVSMTYAILAPDQRTITWARAGHNPTLHFNQALGIMDEIKPRGMVVGMKAGPAFRNAIEECQTQVSPGDVFLLYTDGVTETMNSQGEEFGTDRLKEVLTLLAGRDPDDLVGQIMDRVRHFRGAQPEADDMTLLALAVD